MSKTPTIRTIALVVAIATVGGIVISELKAATGEWTSLTVPIGAPIRNTRLHQQPRPVSAPAAVTGDAVQLIGTIESWPVRQPRPISASPKWSGTERPQM